MAEIFQRGPVACSINSDPPSFDQVRRHCAFNFKRVACYAQLSQTHFQACCMFILSWNTRVACYISWSHTALSACMHASMYDYSSEYFLHSCQMIQANLVCTLGRWMHQRCFEVAIDIQSCIPQADSRTRASQYTGGIINDSTPGNETDHVVVIAGWGLDPVSHMPYWVGRNSYGTRWGEGAGGGWFRLRRGANTLGLEANRCSWAVPAATDVQRAMRRAQQARGEV